MEEQLEKELRFHLEQHAADLVARGHDPAEARRLARLALGGPEQVKEGCRDARGTRWVEDLWQDLRYAVRVLAAEAGICGGGAVYAGPGDRCDHGDVHGDQRGAAEAAAVSRARPADPAAGTDGLEHGLGQPVVVHLPQLCGLPAREPFRWRWRPGVYGGGMVSQARGRRSMSDGREISSELFPVLGVSMARGRAFLPEEDRPGAAPVAIIGYALWQRRFAGSPAAIGMPLVFDGKSYTVVGIAPAGFPAAGRRRGCVHAARAGHRAGHAESRSAYRHTGRWRACGPA